ncbi:MAG: hypothetical protein K9I85_09890 [Saprospiraceae bacterium]|nr:hypothetical protein [Saprospiraceae bacterium]
MKSIIESASFSTRLPTYLIWAFIHILGVNEGCVQAKPPPELIGFSYSECHDEENDDAYKNHILEFVQSGDTATFNVSVVSDCCSKFEGQLELSNRTLTLDYTNTGDVCDCYCVYQMQFVIRGVHEDTKTILFHKEELQIPAKK